jgi:tetratricopeptide (TPR) repeat protein
VHPCTLPAALQYFWRLRGYLREGRQHLTTALEYAEGQAVAPERANALYGRANLAFCQADYPAAEADYIRSLEDWRVLGGMRGQSNALIGLGNVAYGQGDFARAQKWYADAVPFAEGDDDRVATLLSNLGNIAFHAQDFVTAEARFQEAVVVFRRAGNEASLAGLFNGLGSVAMYTGDLEPAHLHLSECLRLCRNLGDLRIATYALEGCGYIAYRRGLVETGIGLYSAVDALRTQVGMVMSPTEQTIRDGALEEMCAVIGEAAYEEAWQRGQMLSFENAIETALSLPIPGLLSRE